MKNKDLKVVQNHKMWFIISLAVITLGLVIFAILAGVGKDVGKGLNFGIEFTGGTQLDVELGSLLNEDNKEEVKNTILSTLDENGIKDRNIIQLTGSKLTGDNRIIEGYTITYRADKDKTDLVLNGSGNVLSLKARLLDKLNINNADLIQVNSNEVTGKIKTSALFYVLIGVLVAYILIMAYIAFRFELSTAVTSAMGLVHDGLILFALMAIFRIPINLSFFAALIALICYSIYNSIIVFDRMRTNSRRESMKDSSASDLAEISVKEVSRRILCTTGVLSIMVLPLIITGVAAVIWLVIPVILGLIIGTYSNMFVVPSMWALFKAKQKNKKGKVEYFKKRVLFKRTEKTESVTPENQKDE